MKIFIWKSHGSIEVYDISTQEKYDEVVQKLKTLLERNKLKTDNCTTIMDYVWRSGMFPTHSLFETGTTIGVLQ